MLQISQEWAKQWELLARELKALELAPSVWGPFVALGQSGWVVLAREYGMPVVKVVELGKR